MSVKISRTDMSSEALRAYAFGLKDVKVVRRVLAIAHVLDGEDRGTAGAKVGVGRQTICDWVHRYNDHGVAGLNRRKHTGRPSRLSSEQKATLAKWVEDGPDQNVDGVVRWRCVDLKAKIEKEFGVTMHERTVGKHLEALGFKRLSVRPKHPKSDTHKQENFKKTSRTL